jgi:hypothetical protein
MIPVPGTHDRALGMALREAPEPADKRNAVAGYSWAVTLVNLRQPRAVSSLLARAVGRGVCGAFSNGFASALMAWKHMSPPNERFIEPYLHAVPGPCPPSVWEKFASVPARAAFETIYPGLLRNNTVAKIFAYRTTSELKQLASAKEETTLETCQ